jgi:hypothetical protein
MTLDQLMVPDGPAAYYNPGMMNVFEDHMNYLRTHPLTQYKEVDPALAYQYEYDLKGLFQKMNISQHLHYIVLRMNGYTTFNDKLGDALLLMVPNPDEIDRIKQSYTSKNPIS